MKQAINDLELLQVFTFRTVAERSKKVVVIGFEKDGFIKVIDSLGEITLISGNFQVEICNDVESFLRNIKKFIKEKPQEYAEVIKLFALQEERKLRESNRVFMTPGGRMIPLKITS